MTMGEVRMFARKHRSLLPARRSPRSVLAAAREGANHDVWLQVALRKLQAAPGVARCGVWLETASGEDTQPDRPGVLRGEIRETTEGTGLGEWTRLSLEPPLPLARLTAGETVEFRTGGESKEPIAGPAMGMRRRVWVPVVARGALRGVVLLAAAEGDAALPRDAAEEVAEELALALEWQELHRLAGERKTDLEFSTRVQTEMAGGAAGDALLQEIAESCTHGDGELGAGAVFALVGERRTGLAVTDPAGARAEERLIVRALSGESAWAHSVEQGPLEMFWRRAVETGQTIGAEANALPLAREIARIVAIPLLYEGTARGVLLAGLPQRRTNLESMERLERRAGLAAAVLQQEARRAEREQQEAWRQALLAASETPVLLLDQRGFLRGASQGAAKIFARDARLAAIRWETPEVRFAELFRPREWERANRWLRRETSRDLVPAKPVLAEEEAPEKALRAELQDGTEVECRAMNLENGEFFGVTLEPAAHSQRERSKEEVEVELRQTIGWMEEGIVVFDEGGRVRAANERFHRMLGLTTEEAASAITFEELLRIAAPHARDPEGFENDWRALADSPEGDTQEELLMDWPAPQTLERCTREIAAENGRRLGRVEVYREMTARRMFQSRMAQTEKLASLGQRVGGILHDLSNPLTTILGYAQRLVARAAAAGNGPQVELRGILGEAERATGILRQLLRLSGEERSTREPLSLNELVDRTVDLMRATLAGSPIRLVLEKEPGLARVEGDFGQLQQVLLNLLQNAQQAIEQSGKGGLIGVRTGSAGEGRVRLEVWDDGPGVPGAIQARIFDPFFTTKPPGVGTGLGLAIVLGFVRQHGGTVNLLSAPRGGTRFLVELPALQVAARLPEPPEVIRFAPRRRSPAGGLAGEARAARVLVVEDEPTVGGLIADVLRDEGMRVDVLRDGHAALARAEYETYDLVICDLKMPGMDGKKFFHSLGQRHNPLQEHVLFVTGDVVAPGTQEFLERHGLPYVAKPFRVEELSRAVREML
jgi:signal transduction histidine kinase/CheY-like chemotaxis protein